MVKAGDGRGAFQQWLADAVTVNRTARPMAALILCCPRMVPVRTHRIPVPPPPHAGRTDTLIRYTPSRYTTKVAIRSFANQALERFFVTGTTPKSAAWARTARVAARKLDMLDYAATLSDMRSPPGNRLEALKGDLRGMYSIRINEQWRVVFRWTDGRPIDVDIRDYH